MTLLLSCLVGWFLRGLGMYAQAGDKTGVTVNFLSAVICAFFLVSYF